MAPRVGLSQGLAESNSAIQQSATLRYSVAFPKYWISKFRLRQPLARPSNQIPWLARGPAQKFRGFWSADDFLLRGVPMDFSARSEGNIAKMGDDSGAVSGLHVCHRSV